MNVEQYVMAYHAEQDRLRAMLPEGFTSLRPVLRINAEIREKDGEETVYLEFNTPVAFGDKRGWRNIARWESPADPFSYERDGKSVTFRSPFLTITFTGVGLTGGCPAERDNDGCFYPGEGFVPAEKIDSGREFCDCEFAWRFREGDAHGKSIGKTLPAFLTDSEKTYPAVPLTAENAAAIPCDQVLGSYVVKFTR